MIATAAELQILLTLKDAYSQGLKDAGANTDGFASKVKSLIAPLAGLAAGFASFKTLESAISSTQELGAEVSKLSRETGLGAEDASRLLEVFKHFGQSGDDASRSLGQFAKNLTIAHEETLGFSTTATTTQKLFESLGITVQTTSGQMRPLNDVLLDVADKFHGMQDGAEKTGIAMQLFGKSGKDMIPILDQGSAGIADLEKEADKLGVTLTAQNLTTIKQYTASQRDLKEAFAGLKLEVGVEVMPVLTDFSNWFTDHQGDIRRFVSEAIGQFKTLGSDASEGLGMIRDGLQWIPDNKAVIELAIAGIGTAIVASLGPASFAYAAVATIVVLLGKIGKLKSDNELSSLQTERQQLLDSMDQANVRLGNEEPVGGGTLRDKLLAQRGQVDAPVEQQKLSDITDRLATVNERIKELTTAGTDLGAVAGAAIPPVVKLAGPDGLGAIPPAANKAKDAAAEAAKKLAEAMQRMSDSIGSALEDDDISFKEFTDINKQALKDGLEPLTAAYAGHLEAAQLLTTSVNGNAEEVYDLTKNMTKLTDVMKTSGVEAVKLGVTFAQDVVGKIRDAFSSISGGTTKEEATLDLQIAQVQQRIAGFNAASGGQDITAALAPDNALLASLQRQRDLMSANNDVAQKQFTLANQNLLTTQQRDKAEQDLIGDQRLATGWIQQNTTDFANLSPAVQGATTAMQHLMLYIATLMQGGQGNLQLAARGV